MIAVLVLALLAYTTAQTIIGIVPDAPLVGETEYGPGTIAYRTPSSGRDCQVAANSTEWLRLLKIHTDSAFKAEPEAVLVTADKIFVPAIHKEILEKNCKNSSIAPLNKTEMERWGVWELQDLKHTHIVSIGDIHGDFWMLQKVLWMARVVDHQGKWRGGSSRLVQTVAPAM